MPTPRRDHLAGTLLVWIARLSQSGDALPFFEPWLDTRERARAARFHFPDDRARFVLGRGMARKCLGDILDQAPEAVALTFTARDRPVLAQDDRIQFSISHTQDLVAFAVTDGARIGIDVEAVQPHSDLLELAKRILSTDELALFTTLPESEKLPAFHRVWTRKEAYLKARGEGIAERLQQISVSMGLEETVTLHDGRADFPEEKWRLLPLPLPTGYAGALACDDPARRLDGTYIFFAQGEPVPDPTSPFTSATHK